MTVARRRLGSDGPELSQITYGMMRLGALASVGDAAEHLCRLHDAGIDTHHSSGEYDCYDLYLAALERARASGREFRHVVKVAEPGFDHDRFDGSRLTRLLDRRLADLGVDTIHSLQWLVRTPDPQATGPRVALLADQAAEIADWTATQLDAGKIRNLSSFPYSVAFAEAIVESGLVSTATIYLNEVELDYVPLLDLAAAVIAIRPLAGGELGDRATDPAASPIRFPLLHPAVTTVVASINSAAHVEHAVAAAGDLRSDADAFAAMAASPPSTHG